jgi:serine O-acetyltransferase
LLDVLRADVGRLSGVSPGLWSIVRCFFGRAGFQAVVFYRLAAAGHGKGILGRIGARFFARLNISCNACDIDPGSQIGPGLKIPHPCGIVIGPCRIGRNFMILQNVTIGMKRFSDDEASPESYPDIGDDVTISSGAAILGGLRIGSGSLIGANAVVLSNIPDGRVAVGAPAKLVPIESGQ